MNYKSTRGKINNLTFTEAVMMGLADDGGLLIPDHIPKADDCLSEWRNYSFTELSLAVMSQFIEDDIPRADLESIIQNSYKNFDHSEITPVVPIGKVLILELFHGPTFAFKDVALQFLGNLFEYLLKKLERKLTVIGATSGDTGSAAIYGLRGRKNVSVFMLHPKGRVSPIQERQMTTVLDENIHNLAVEGTFDDAQEIIKSLFNELEFKQEYQLGAVNSINWARVLAQIVYYFYAYFKVQSDSSQPVNFSVPTGNFGDVLAGYYAKKMGLPIDKLIVATNQNDILHRFFGEGHYHKNIVRPSWSPSMDIQVSSNFERYLYYLADQDADQMVSWMDSFQQSGKLTLSGEVLKQAQSEMLSTSVSESETLETIKNYHQKYQYLLDPHTAVGVKAAEAFDSNHPTICLATAHPAKFGQAVKSAINSEPQLPPGLAALKDLETRCQVIPATKEAVRNIIVQTLK